MGFGYELAVSADALARVVEVDGARVDGVTVGPRGRVLELDLEGAEGHEGHLLDVEVADVDLVRVRLRVRVGLGLGLALGLGLGLGSGLKLRMRTVRLSGDCIPSVCERDLELPSSHGICCPLNGGVPPLAAQGKCGPSDGVA